MTCFLLRFTCTSFNDTFTFIGRNFSSGRVTNFLFSDDKVSSDKVNLSKSAKIEKKRFHVRVFRLRWPIEVHFCAKFWGVSLDISIFIAKRGVGVSGVATEIAVGFEGSIGTPITSEQSKILTFHEGRWLRNDRIFQIRSTCFFDPGLPMSP